MIHCGKTTDFVDNNAAQIFLKALCFIVYWIEGSAIVVIYYELNLVVLETLVDLILAPTTDLGVDPAKPVGWNQVEA